MAEVIVELIEGYFVEIDSLNHTLKKRYIGKNKKTGEDKEYEKIIGYYKNLPDCIERLVRLIPIDENNNTAITLREYAEASERAFKRVEELSKKLAVGNGRWIPVSERLPELMELPDGPEYLKHSPYCLVTIKWCDGGIDENIGYCDQSGCWDCESESYKVIAWMPLPEPYKGE